MIGVRIGPYEITTMPGVLRYSVPHMDTADAGEENRTPGTRRDPA